MDMYRKEGYDMTGRTDMQEKIARKEGKTRHARKEIQDII
jgi:hypothetical protein